ncbi:bifunctional hydroxymethylpyrimidine kinase/phosphomethylpyrimidine kinase [Thermoleophilia bacterium SCSIO 60948]|nr:bifunctional hydroxymethylpyrimidine kinase/phosphomethylpyrimidine kinase [Thermoleophilia bacterium SCSIO 60948]
MPAAPPACLTIAGSDSGGGAGIQADLKAFARCGVHGTSAITALTAQNTVGVLGVEPVPPEFIVAQIDAVADDIAIAAVKVGMLGDARTAEAVAGAIERRFADVPVVVDPVMVSESGGTLLETDAEDVLARRVIPLATVTTPNVSEARRLAIAAGLSPAEAEAAGQGELARAIQGLGVEFVVVTGGHTERGRDALMKPGRKRPDWIHSSFDAAAKSAHGSGCTHSSSLAAFLAHGLDVSRAATEANAIASFAVRHGIDSIGGGPGPVDALGLPRRTEGGLAWFTEEYQESDPFRELPF